MASPSAPYPSPKEKYDVFLSFRGEDTRDGFTGYLYNALCQKKILTYKDDENLESGHDISEIMEAIKESKICIIVFSKDFASSTWCLDEVVRILDCKRNRKRVIIPIFYDIEPSIVRKQEFSYAESFAKHEQRFQDNMDKVMQWRDALKEVVGLSGYDSKNLRPEYVFIEKIVEDVSLKLSKCVKHFKSVLVGIEKPIEDIERLLCIGTLNDNIRIIGLYGMGGIGKTTLARSVFQKFHHHFESYCFLNDVREEYDRHGINHLREKVLFELFKDKNYLNMELTPVRDRCRRTKVFIVLDDLDAIFQLNKLLPRVYEFAVGSRIIITTRDAQVLRSMANELYEVKRLNDFAALKLFRMHAFGQNSDLPGYESLSKSMANYADGNPLALEVLGSSLYSKSIKEWQSALGKLKIDPNKDIQKVLKVSYDGLGDEGLQRIFLDVACFYEGEVDREHVESILHCSDEHSDATYGISILIDKSLIIECQERLSMHALLRQMGKAIVCNEDRKPENRSRLWKAKDVYHVLERKIECSTIEGMLLNQSELENDVYLRHTTFSEMKHLRFLRIHFDNRFCDGGTYHYEKLGWAPYSQELCYKIYLPTEGIEYLSHELRYLQWDSYFFKYLPPNFSPKNLVELVMRGSQLVELFWNEYQPFGKLKKMDLSYSQHLVKIPNLSSAVNLGSISLRGCTRLLQVPFSFKNLEKLQFLDLSDCTNLNDGIENLPSNVMELKLCGTAIKGLPNSIRCLLDLSNFDLSGCENLEYGIEFLPENIKKLRLCGTAIEMLPSSIEHLMVLVHLDLYNCERLRSLPQSIWKLKSLGWLDLSNCPSLVKLPEVSKDHSGSSSLRCLKLSGCTGLKIIPELPSSLTCLAADNCTSLQRIFRWRTPSPQYQNNINGGNIYNFDGCLELDYYTRNNIIDNHASCRFLSAQDDISYLETFYPESRIPSWFEHLCEDGNSISIHFPANWFDVNDPSFKFVFCAVFELNTSGLETKIRFRFNFKNDSHIYHYKDVCMLQVNNNKSHLLIRYSKIDLRDVFGPNWSYVCNNVTEAPFCVSLDGGNTVSNMNIRMCGLNLISNRFSGNIHRDISSSSSSSTSKKKCYVCINSRGVGFTGHLYNALCQREILTYNLENCHTISETEQAINESKICLIVFSKDYKCSKRCLDEVVHMLECKRDEKDVIIPIFYEVEPSIVLEQLEGYAISFVKDEVRFQDNMEKEQKWRDALKEVTALRGYHSKDFGPDYKFVDKIVEDILLKLPKSVSTSDHFRRTLIGIEKPVKEIEGLLCIGSMDVRIIGLYGMGGIGKTTLTSAVFQKFYHHFERFCFLENVTDIYSRQGINHLRKKLVYELFKDNTFLSMESTPIQDRCGQTKVLIILDDVESVFQLNELLPEAYEFGVGSRIIVTTRDTRVVKSRTDKIYEVKRLNDLESLELFCLHAFGQNSDRPGYEVLARTAANYAQGNPLALKVLGSSLHSKRVEDWKNKLYFWRRIPDPKIHKVLQTSYRRLDNKGVQDIFLLIALRFHGEVDREYVEGELRCSGHSDVKNGINVLIDKSLLIEHQNKLSMHPLLRQMGEYIASGRTTLLWAF